MNREKMIDELEDVYLLKLGTWSSEYAAIAVDYMIEKFGPLVEAAKKQKIKYQFVYADDEHALCDFCQAAEETHEVLKKMEE